MNDCHANRALLAEDGPCSFLTRPIRELTPGTFERAMCGAPAAYDIIGTISGQQTRLCVAHTAALRGCPACASLIARVSTAT